MLLEAAGSVQYFHVVVSFNLRFCATFSNVQYFFLCCVYHELLRVVCFYCCDLVQLLLSFVQGLSAAETFMCAASESKTNSPSGTIKYILSCLIADEDSSSK